MGHSPHRLLFISASRAALVEFVKASMSVALSDGDLDVERYVINFPEEAEHVPYFIGEAEALSLIAVHILHPPIGTLGVAVCFVCMGEYLFYVGLHGVSVGCCRTGVLRYMS